MPNLIISELSIRQDAEGRYCLNDLHKAAGGEERHAPNRFTRTDGYQDLVTELTLTPEMASAFPVNIIKSGNPGTFVVKELVYAYAMWISPAFHLKVIRAYDSMVTAPKPIDPMQALNDPAMMRGLLLTYTDKVLTLEAKVEEQAPKVEALERLEGAEGSLCIMDAAKGLKQKPRELFGLLSSKRWIFKRPGCAHWLGYQDKVQAGLLEHKATTIRKEDGSEKITEQVRITAKGMARLAVMLGNGGMQP